MEKQTKKDVLHLIFWACFLKLYKMKCTTLLRLPSTTCISKYIFFECLSHFSRLIKFSLAWICFIPRRELLFFFFFRSALGRARAWLRLALMQKKLADYFRHLLDQGDEVLSEFYEPRALLRSDEAAIVTGLLLSLNVVDCNLCVKVCVNN